MPQWGTMLSCCIDLMAVDLRFCYDAGGGKEHVLLATSKCHLQLADACSLCEERGNSDTFPTRG